MRNKLLLCVAVLSLGSCSVLKPPTPAQQLATLVEKHPELATTDTIKVEQTFRLPKAEFTTLFVPVRNAHREAQDSLQIDSLLRKLDVSLDSVEHLVARQRLLSWAKSRPVLYDTLCFDTLGIQGRVWRENESYQLWIMRKAIEAKTDTAVVVAKLKPCPGGKEYAWYEAEGWPWWLLLLIGTTIGAVLTYLIFSLAVRTAR